MTINWISAIAEFAAALRIAGQSPRTIRTRVEHLQHFARVVKVEPFAVTSRDITGFVGGMPWAAETRRGRYNSYRMFWSWAMESGLIDADPSAVLPKVKPGIANPRPVPDRIYRKALMKARPRERLFLELAHDHGLRRGEVAEIHSSDVFEDLVGHSLTVHGKGGKDRTVPLTPWCARALLEAGPGWIFPGEENGHLSPRWIGRRVSDLLGGGWTMHKLRHSAGTNFYVNGDLAIAQKLLGHASPATTMIYVKLPDERLRATIMASAS